MNSQNVKEKSSVQSDLWSLMVEDWGEMIKISDGFCMTRRSVRAAG